MNFGLGAGGDNGRGGLRGGGSKEQPGDNSQASGGPEGMDCTTGRALGPQRAGGRRNDATDESGERGHDRLLPVHS